MTRKPRSHVRTFNISNVGFCYPDTGGHFLRILSDNCNLSVQRYLYKLHADGNHGCRWCIHRYLNKKQKKMNFSLKKIKSYSYHRADQWPFRVNNGLQSLLLKCLTCSFFLVDSCCKIAFWCRSWRLTLVNCVSYQRFNLLNLKKKKKKTRLVLDM